ncbi:MAG: hypothetical protein PUJ93_05815 [Oscillospiraceae bacterium]|nr:hypothetical protein [Oscillospiraceae bacterium]MDY5735321.1 hypothetical protein [Oscillospiraceae bacterium]
MNEWEEKLNTLLSDPDAMSQVVNMAQALSAQMGGSAPQGEGSTAPPPPPQNASPPPDAGNPFSQLGAIDPELLQRLIPVIKQMNRPESSETSAFLYALRPFLKPSRRDKVDRAVQLARMIHLAKTFFNSQEG